MPRRVIGAVAVTALAVLLLSKLNWACKRSIGDYQQENDWRPAMNLDGEVVRVQGFCSGAAGGPSVAVGIGNSLIRSQTTYRGLTLLAFYQRHDGALVHVSARGGEPDVIGPLSCLVSAVSCKGTEYGVVPAERVPTLEDGCEAFSRLEQQ